MGICSRQYIQSVQYVVTNLIDIVSKNGNLLLNIRPRSDGTITEEETNVLLGTGKWLNVNGNNLWNKAMESIWQKDPTESASGSFADQKIPF